jgi:NAD(P)H-dependent FMN reductase
MDQLQVNRPRVLVFAASTRGDSLHRKLAREAFTALETTGIDATLADLRAFPMPLYEGDVEAAQGLPAHAKAFKDLLRRHDVFVIASPEYNGSFSALVKNVIDWSSRPEPGEKSLAVFRGKTAALLSASPGPGGGRRGLKHLGELLEMIGVNVFPERLSIARAFEAFDSEGKLTRSEDRSGLEKLIAEVASALAAKSEAAA